MLSALIRDASVCACAMLCHFQITHTHTHTATYSYECWCVYVFSVERRLLCPITAYAFATLDPSIHICIHRLPLHTHLDTSHFGHHLMHIRDVTKQNIVARLRSAYSLASPRQDYDAPLRSAVCVVVCECVSLFGRWCHTPLLLLVSTHILNCITFFFVHLIFLFVGYIELRRKKERKTHKQRNAKLEKCSNIRV